MLCQEGRPQMNSRIRAVLDGRALVRKALFRPVWLNEAFMLIRT